MTLEITVRDLLEPIKIEAEMIGFINDMNIAAASGKHFVIAQEKDRGPVAFETRNVTVIRDIEEDAFLG